MMDEKMHILNYKSKLELRPRQDEKPQNRLKRLRKRKKKSFQNMNRRQKIKPV